MSCSLCGKFIWFWQDWDDDKNNGIAHQNCLEDCKEVLELERKTKIHVKKESERLEQKRLEDARKVRQQIINDLDNEESEEKLKNEMQSEVKDT